MQQVTRIGVDLAKNTFEIYGVDTRGQAAVSRRLGRERFLEVMAQMPACRVVMEACASAHYWAHKLDELGHEAKLITPERAARYRDGDKTDFRDAAAICEAGGRPWMTFVPVKAQWQLEWQALHRVREQVLKQRNALSNQLRGLLLEHGFRIPKGLAPLRKRLPEILEDAENGLSEHFRWLLNERFEALGELEDQLSRYTKELQRLAKTCNRCQRLMDIAGIGSLAATALVAAVGDAREFHSARQLSAWLGLVPREFSSGDERRMGRITKRGDTYLRTLVIQGARSAVSAAGGHSDGRSQWIQRLKRDKGFNKAAVALANKNMRTVWALLAKDEAYRPMAA